MLPVGEGEKVFQGKIPEPFNIGAGNIHVPLLRSRHKGDISDLRASSCEIMVPFSEVNGPFIVECALLRLVSGKTLQMGQQRHQMNKEEGKVWIRKR